MASRRPASSPSRRSGSRSRGKGKRKSTATVGKAKPASTNKTAHKKQEGIFLVDSWECEEHEKLWAILCAATGFLLSSLCFMLLFRKRHLVHPPSPTPLPSCLEQSSTKELAACLASSACSFARRLLAEGPSHLLHLDPTRLGLAASFSRA